MNQIIIPTICIVFLLYIWLKPSTKTKKQSKKFGKGLLQDCDDVTKYDKVTGL